RLVHIYYSKDKGQTWQFQAEVDSIHWAGLFVIRDTVYLLGREGKSHSMAISRSTDRGKTWTSLSILKKRQKHGYHGSSTPIVIHNGRDNKADDHHVPDKHDRALSDNGTFSRSASTDAKAFDS